MRWMHVAFALASFVAGIGLADCGDDDDRAADLAMADLAMPPVDTVDPCGPKSDGHTYACDFLVGNCPTPGLSCVCRERGTMVCQQNRQWELILDHTQCPDPEATHGSYQGLGCLGGAERCGSCLCDRGPMMTYQCPDAG